MPKAKKKSSQTLGDIFKKASNLQANQVLYGLLLIAVFLLGYLISRVQYLEKSSNSSTGTQQTGTAQNQPVAAADPKIALEKLEGKSRLPIKGESNAKVNIVEFSDFECPFCARFFKDSLGQITSEYIDSGKVNLEYRHFPLAFHPQAKPLALVSECANDQGKFWEMHDKIFEINADGKLTGADADTYKGWAQELGLNATEFNSCYDEGKHNEVIDADTKLGSELGVSGTPTFYINGQQIVGAVPFKTFKDALDCTLEDGKFTLDANSAVTCDK